MELAIASYSPGSSVSCVVYQENVTELIYFRALQGIGGRTDDTRKPCDNYSIF